MANRRLLTAAALLAGLVAATPANADVSGPDIVSWVNAQRAANGIPAGITEDPALSDGCRKHNVYGSLNGLTHFEEKGKPGYTPEGEQAGKTSILYEGDSWTATNNPFEQAPIHLHQMLAPRIDRQGASENDGFGCATTYASFGRPAPPADVTYTYPGNGAAEWFTKQTAFESPFTPGEKVGIPAGTATGPYLYVMFDGADFFGGEKASGATGSLTESAGAVDIAVVDNTTPGLEGYFPTGMEIIPKQPLKPNTTYTAAISATVARFDGSNQRQYSHTWSFTTRALDNAVAIGAVSTKNRTLRVRGVTSTAPGATVTATGPGAAVTKAVGSDGSASLDLPADGTWKVCARSGGPGTEFIPAENCVDAMVLKGAAGGGATKPYLASLPTKAGRGRAFKATVISTSDFSVSYVVKSGRKTVASAKKKNFKAGVKKTFTIKVPKRYSKKGQKVKLSMKIVIAGKTYTASRTIKFS